MFFFFNFCLVFLLYYFIHVFDVYNTISLFSINVQVTIHIRILNNPERRFECIKLINCCFNFLEYIIYDMTCRVQIVKHRTWNDLLVTLSGQLLFLTFDGQDFKGNYVEMVFHLDKSNVISVTRKKNQSHVSKNYAITH